MTLTDHLDAPAPISSPTLSDAEAVTALIALTRRVSRVTLTVDREPELPAFWGSKIEGVFGWALQSSVCVQPTPTPCEECTFKRQCEWVSIYAPDLISAHPMGTAPRGVRFRPVSASGVHVEFDVLSIGRAAADHDQTMMCLHDLIGRPFGHRASITAVEFQERNVTPGISREQFERHSDWRVHLIHPTSLGEGDAAQNLVRMSVRRLSVLHTTWGTPAPINYAELMNVRFGVRTNRSKLEFVQQPRAHSVVISGATGHVDIEFEHSERAWLCAQLLSHAAPFGVGKNAHFGAGELAFAPL